MVKAGWFFGATAVLPLYHHGIHGNTAVKRMVTALTLPGYFYRGDTTVLPW